MRSILTVLSFIFLGASPALALCQSVPDDASTGYSANATGHALCLQMELHRRTQETAQRARLDAELDNLRIQLQRDQQMLLHRLQQPMFAPPI